MSEPKARRSPALRKGARIGLFAAGALMPTLAGFALLPALTRYLTADEFGAYTLITATYGVFSSLTLLGLNSALVREYYELPDRRTRRELVGAITLAVAGAGFLASILLGGTFAALPGLGSRSSAWARQSSSPASSRTT